MNSTLAKSSQITKRVLTFIRSRSSLEQILLATILFFAFIAFLLGVERVSGYFSTTVPTYGGVLEEGVVGFPEHINPIFAETNTEHDLVALIYSGLMKVNEDGDIVTDLADSYQVNNTETQYTFTLRDDAFFHDGTPITASDVVFTIEQIKNPASESPLRSTFVDIEVEARDASTVVFTLPDPYAGFLEQTTVGIVPQHVWEDVAIDSLRFIELSSYPVGSGPFEVNRVERSADLGVPTHYTLSAFRDYVGGRPYLEKIEVSFFSSEADLVAALEEGSIDVAGLVSPQSLEVLEIAQERITTAPMLRTFGLFFNQTESDVLAEQEVREAINAAVNRDELAQSVFSGYARSIETPLPFGEERYNLGSDEELNPSEVLTEAGWELNPTTGVREKDGETLSFSIATANTEDFEEVANFIKQSLERHGFVVTVETFDVAALNQEVIRPRDYDALLFGKAYGRTVDLYPFWHSSERDDPGLNIARFASTEADDALEALREERVEAERIRLMSTVLEEIEAEVPAVFLYSPEFIYITDEKIKNVTVPPIVRSSDRFTNVSEWFVYTDTVWNIFLEN